MMPPQIITISLPLLFGFGRVNCYLVDTGGGFILIDTGGKSARSQLEQALVAANCRPGSLNLIVLTHGDYDHTGNAGYLRRTFGVKIAMHADDSGMAEYGDMFWNRGKSNPIVAAIASRLFGFGISERFQPDIAIEESTSLSGYGLDAKILSIPGHSKGSIGILTADGELFCGDLLVNSGKRPALNSIIADPAAAQASTEKLRQCSIRAIYPGHGPPFLMEQLIVEPQATR